VTATAGSATEDVAEELEPSASTSEETVFPHRTCTIVAKRDYIAPTVADDLTGDDPTDAADGATDEPAADDDTLGDGADADGLSGEGSTGFDEGVITEEPAETIEDGADLTGP
jgi:hypothetical protein